MNDTPSDPENEPEDWNFNAAVSATHNAAHGDWTQLRARLLDPSVTLTMWEREWLAQQGPKTERRPKTAQEPLLYWWFRNAEGMDRNAAVQAVMKALSKTLAKDLAAVTKAIQRAGWDSFDPGASWHISANAYRSGHLSPDLLPPPLNKNAKPFKEFLKEFKGKTE